MLKFGGKIVTVYSSNHIKHINRLHGQRAGFNMEAGIMCSYHCALGFKVP
jgi:hypothetical protein